MCCRTGTAIEGDRAGAAFGFALPDGRRKILIVYDGEIVDLEDGVELEQTEHYIDIHVRH